ncbi:myosin heavy chain, clone 203-like isoform X2 [Euwallacea fornicatus]|uniref:myosin heavy chain, clone 203-like isoform X2 n=1 Tax=Euwallacea fornicatus TaxID=995702 RepID=UPI00338E802C
MTTYVQNKTRMFMERRDWLKPERRRSESRLKAYPSSTDLRNWCNVVEDRRQHILELVQKRIDRCPGKLVPLDALLNVLMDMAGGAGDCSKIRRCLRQLSSFIAQLKLNSEDLKKLKTTVENMDSKCIASMSKAMAERLRQDRGVDDDDDDEEQQGGRGHSVKDVVEDGFSPEEMVGMVRETMVSHPLPQEPTEDDLEKMAIMEALFSKQRNKIVALMKQRGTLQSKLGVCLRERNQLKQTLKDKMKAIEDLTQERDDLVSKVSSLETQLGEYQNLAGNVSQLRNKLEILDNVLQERDNLCKHIDMMRGMEEEVKRLRVQVEKMDEMEKELKNTSKTARSAELELKKSQSRAGNLETELRNVRCERDVMKKRIESMKKEIDNQRANATKAEMLRLERDLLQIKLSELADLQSRYEDIMEKMEVFVIVKAERDSYKQKYEEVLDGTCQRHILKAQIDEAKTITRERDQLRQQAGNLGTCICECEDEVRGLALQMDDLTSFRSNLSSHEEEIVNKDQPPAVPQGEIAQSQNLNSRVTELEKQLHDAKHTILQKDCRIRCLESQIMDGGGSWRNLPNRRPREIATPMRSASGDPHLKKLLKQSEYAVKRVVQELVKQDKKQGRIEVKNPKRDFGSNQGKCPCVPTSSFNEDDCERLREKLEELQKSELAVKRV